MIEDIEFQPLTESPDTCKVCLGEHDDEIHLATLRVHAWHRQQVTKYFVEQAFEDVA
jgi:hypothetical protein